MEMAEIYKKRKYENFRIHCGKFGIIINFYIFAK